MQNMMCILDATIKSYDVIGFLFLFAPMPCRITAKVIKTPPIIVVKLGTSLIPNTGIHTHTTPPTTSIKDNKASSAAGKYLAPKLYKINTLATQHPCNKLK